MTTGCPVAVLKTSPETYFQDAEKLLGLANFDELFSPAAETILKMNISWQEYYPACSTPPWQLDALLTALKARKFEKIKAVENITVVTDTYKGMKTNKLENVLKKHEMTWECLAEKEWGVLDPSKSLILGKEDKLMPTMIKGAQIIHLPTIKCHGHSQMTCSLKNAFGFLRTARHHYHLHIHEVLVDLLRIQKEHCKSVFSFVDGTIAMDGAGPRTGIPYVKNYLVAGADLVAVDAVVAKMMGFDPMEIGFIKIAHEEGLGNGDVDSIDIAGDGISGVNFGFRTRKDPVIFFDRFFRNSPLEPLFFRTGFFKLCTFVSHHYRDAWLKTVGKGQIDKIMNSEWGPVFKSY